MSNVTRIGPGAWQISHPFLGENEIIGSYLLAGQNELAIIDPGPGSMVESLLESIREAGFDPQEVTHILITHVHLDHAGSAGTLVRQLPKAQVYTHKKGAPHLLDTTKVVASASRIYGERMKLLWGEIESTPQERLTTIEGATFSTLQVDAWKCITLQDMLYTMLSSLMHILASYLQETWRVYGCKMSITFVHPHHHQTLISRPGQTVSVL